MEEGGLPSGEFGRPLQGQSLEEGHQLMTVAGDSWEGGFERLWAADVGERVQASKAPGQ